MNKRLLAVVTALLLAIGGAALVVFYAKNADQRAVAAQSPKKIWIANAVIPAGTTLKDAQRTQLIAETTVAEKGYPAGALEDIGPSNNELLALSDVQPGEFLMAARFGPTPIGEKAIEVPKGKLAISIELSDPARVGKFVTPGSKIAIYQSYKLVSLADTPEAKLINDKDFTGTSILLPEVEVIGMGDAAFIKPKPAGNSAQDAAATQQSPSFLVTVAVTPEDAPVLIHGINNRILYAGLRGPDVTIDKQKSTVSDLTLRDRVPQ